MISVDRDEQGERVPDHSRRAERRAIGRRLRRSAQEFLLVPTALILGFVLLAIASIMLDRVRSGTLQRVRDALTFFIEPEVVVDLLSAIAGGLVTVASITFSVLLLAVQQTATSMSPVVFDQFLRRKGNQAYFGFFVGLAVYSFLVMAMSKPDLEPQFGAMVALTLIIVALILLVVLIYSTIDQMRSSSVVASIHELAQRARRREATLIARTRAEPRAPSDPAIEVRTDRTGFVTGIDVDAIAAVAATVGDVEVVLEVVIGSHVAFNDLLASIRGQPRGDVRELIETIEAAVRLERSRDLGVDPSYAVAQLRNIGWTASSSAQHNPETALLAAKALRDLLARWAEGATGRPTSDRETPIVVYRDRLTIEVIDALAAMAVAAQESRQQQTAAEILSAFAGMMPRLDETSKRRAEEAIMRILPTLGAHVVGFELARALTALRDTLDREGSHDVRDAVARALDRKEDAVGTVDS